MINNDSTHILSGLVGDFDLFCVEQSMEGRIAWKMLLYETDEFPPDISSHIITPGWIEPYCIPTLSFAFIANFCCYIFFSTNFNLSLYPACSMAAW